MRSVPRFFQSDLFDLICKVEFSEQSVGDLILRISFDGGPDNRALVHVEGL
jgi:hypothetical protein